MLGAGCRRQRQQRLGGLVAALRAEAPDSGAKGGVPDERAKAPGVELVHADEEQDLEVRRVGDGLQVGDPSHLAQADPAEVATGAKRRQRGDGARRVEDEIPERRDAAEGREIVLATQPPQLHQLEAPDLVEDRDVGDRAEAAFEPAKPGERAEPLEVDGPDPQALEPDEAADRVDVLPGPVDRRAAGAAGGPRPPASRGASACPRARAPRATQRRGGGRRASPAAANERPGYEGRGTSAASRGPRPPRRSAARPAATTRGRRRAARRPRAGRGRPGATSRCGAAASARRPPRIGSSETCRPRAGA